MWTWFALDTLAPILAAAGEMDTAVRVYAAGTPARETHILTFKTLLGDFRERTHGTLERAKDDPQYVAAWNEGLRLSREDAIALALTAAGRLERETKA
jgi:hypothetical protein